MKRLLLMDKRDYSDTVSVIERVAVRGIIFREGKLLMIESEAGELKLPGGGQEEGEDDITTLIREVREETGYEVLPDTVTGFGYIEEKRRSYDEPAIWHQFSHLYFCEVSDTCGECDYSERERKAGFSKVWYTPDEAAGLMFSRKNGKAWNSREYNTINLIKEYQDRGD